MRAALGAHGEAAQATIERLAREDVLGRLDRGDYTLWKNDPTEITNRLGWLTIADRMAAELPAILDRVREVAAAGYTDALLLGMGGSSLAPEVFQRTFAAARIPGHLALRVLDSTDPEAVASHARRLDPARTLCIVSTKSGGTVETFSFFRYFYRWMVRAVGEQAAGKHFIAITDPGSALADLAHDRGFRATFLNDPDIGGRYSALSHFGLVPAALVGVDVARLIQRAHISDDDRQTAGQLGAIMGELAARGVDKTTFAISSGFASFASWVEQLIAESTGKDDRSVVPVADEPLGPPSVYGNDRLFVYLRLAGDSTHDAAIDQLMAAGQPVIRFDLSDVYDLGSQFMIWEIATAVAGWRLGINPFDQPNVEAAKVLTRQMVKSFETTGRLPELTTTASDATMRVFTVSGAPRTGPTAVSDTIGDFLRSIKAGDYFAIQAYVAPTDDTTALLERLRTAVRDRFHVATTVGYGPRFLHSTGQMHKGDGGNGIFLQIVTLAPPAASDVPIPDDAMSDKSTMTFGVLKVAQSLGDRQALIDRGRRVLRLEGRDVHGIIAAVNALLS